MSVYNFVRCQQYNYAAHVIRMAMTRTTKLLMFNDDHYTKKGRPVKTLMDQVVEHKNIYARSERSERSAQLLAFKRENFVYSRTKTATSPCVHFEVATSPTEKKTSLLHVSILSRFEIVKIIGQNTQ